MNEIREVRGGGALSNSKRLCMQGEFPFQLSFFTLLLFYFIFLQTLIKYGEAQLSNASVAYVISALATVRFENDGT
jgi:hypothetical protein